MIFVLARTRIFSSAGDNTPNTPRTLDHVGEAGAGGPDEVSDAEAQHDVVSAAARVYLLQIQNAAIDEDRNGLPVREGRGPAHGKAGDRLDFVLLGETRLTGPERLMKLGRRPKGSSLLLANTLATR